MVRVARREAAPFRQLPTRFTLPPTLPKQQQRPLRTAVLRQQQPRRHRQQQQQQQQLRCPSTLSSLQRSGATMAMMVFNLLITISPTASFIPLVSPATTAPAMFSEQELQRRPPSNHYQHHYQHRKQLQPRLRSHEQRFGALFATRAESFLAAARRRLFSPEAYDSRRWESGIGMVGPAAVFDRNIAQGEEGDPEASMAELVQPVQPAEILPAKVDVSPEPAEQVPFDLDVAVFLANFAFLAYKDPGDMVWEVPGETVVRIKDISFVPKVYPGLVTVSLLKTDALPKIVLRGKQGSADGGSSGDGSDGENTQRQQLESRTIDPCVTMVISDKDFASETKEVRANPARGGASERFWGRVVALHVHDPETSVLEVGLWDQTEDGYSLSGIPMFSRGNTLVGSARVPLRQVLGSMRDGKDNSWTGWVEIDPLLAGNGAEDDGGDSSVWMEDKRPRLLVDLRFAPMTVYHDDELPTAPRVTDSPDGSGLLPGAGTVMSVWRKVADNIGSRPEGSDAKGGSAEWNPVGVKATTTMTTTASGEMSNEQTPAPAGTRGGRVSDVGHGDVVELATEEGTSTREATLTEKIKRRIASVVAGELEQPDNDNDSGNNNNSNSNQEIYHGSGGGEEQESGSPPHRWGWMWGGAVPKERGYEPSDRDGKGSSGMGTAEGKSPGAWGVGKVSPKEREEVTKKAAGDGSRREVVLGEDGLPDWSVLMRRVGGLAQETGSFSASCFVENDATDTQVGVWRDGRNKRLVVAFRGTEEDRWRDVLTDVNFFLDELDTAAAAIPIPSPDDLVATVLNTTRAWKTERVRPLAETLSEQTEGVVHAMSSVFSRSGSNEGGRKLEEEKTPPLLSTTTNSTADTDSSLSTTERASSILQSVKGALSLGIEPAQAAPFPEETSGRAKEEEENMLLPSESEAVDDDGGQAEEGDDGGRVGTRLGSGLGLRSLNRRKDDDLDVDDGNGEEGDKGGNYTWLGMQGREKKNSAVGLMYGAGQKKVDDDDDEEIAASSEVGGGGGSSRSRSGSNACGTARGMLQRLTKWEQGDAAEGGKATTDDEENRTAALVEAKEREDSDDGGGGSGVGGGVGALAGYVTEQVSRINADSAKDLLGRVNELRDAIEGMEGIGGVQERGKRVIEGNVRALQELLTNATTPAEDSDGDSDGGGTPKIHSGFKNAYLSVNQTLSGVVVSATDGRPEDWHVFFTGHSLGGALATLAALDLSRRCPDTRVTMYNFGSPRVGNRAFARFYDSHVGDSFRIVNNMDVVARLPRARMGRIALDYAHAGRTVMVAEDPSEAPWIEGKSDGVSPLEETDPVAVLTKGKTDFFNAEMKMLQALFSGEGIKHHMEHTYFAALDSFVAAAPPGEGSA